MKIFTPNTRAFPKVFTQEPLRFGDIYLNYGTVVTIVLTLILSVGLQYFMKKTKYGKAEDYGAAKLVGINVIVQSNLLLQ